MSFLNKTVRKIIFRQMAGWSSGSIASQRARQEKTTKYLRLPANTTCQPVRVNGMPAEWVAADKEDRGVFLYLHGGAYSLGSIKTHRELAARLAHATGLRGLIIDYRLAPEHPYPAALEDTLASYTWLLEQGIDPSEIFIIGDSAGGGLALAALLQLRDTGRPLPAGAICLSPWTDLACTGVSMDSRSKADGILDGKSLEMYAGLYAGDKDKKLPFISPLYGNLNNLPPILVQVGTEEILFDDAVRFTKKAMKAGVDVSLEIWEEMFHVFQMFSFLLDTKKAMEGITKFVSRNLVSKQKKNTR